MLLLDTHVIIWALTEPERLGSQTRRKIAQPDAQLAVATISTLEIAQLAAKKRITLQDGTKAWIAAAVRALGCTIIELTNVIAVESYALPGEFHKDPVDRVLVATARTQSLKFVTADQQILGYRHVVTIDARK
jgi:PIN domain nuclease of toxin-antitoxin system